MKSVLWRVAERLSYIEDAWCLKVNLSSVACMAQPYVPTLFHMFFGLKNRSNMFRS